MMEEEKKDEENKSEPQWEKRDFAIYKRMREVCEVGIKVTEAEITSLKRKLEKLQYGS